MTNYANLNIQKMSPYKPPIEGRSSAELLRLDFNERTIPRKMALGERLVADDQTVLELDNPLGMLRSESFVCY